MSAPTGLDFQVRKDDLQKTRLIPSAEAPLEDGQVLFKVDHFAFTANNITYAVAGEAMSYWGFFLAEEGWGRVPVWGFGDVIESNHPDIKVGARYYGYYPMSTYLTVTPDRVKDDSFFDGAAHRLQLPPIYNQYVATKGDPIYAVASEPMQMLFRPLFWTSFLIDDFLADNDFFGAEAIVISSASSKTSFGAAFLLAARKTCRVVGLTSASNVPFVEALGCYDEVVTYDNIKNLDATRPVAFVDVAGSATVRSDLHHHMADNMKYSCSVGASHWEQATLTTGGDDDLPGAKPTLFFAPSQGQKRRKELGADVFEKKFLDTWGDFIAAAETWISIEQSRGGEAAAAVYQATLSGSVRPDRGIITSLGDK